MRVELRELPVDVAVEASNTARTFVVVLDSLQTMCMGIRLVQVFRRDLLSVLLVKVFLYNLLYFREDTL